MKILSEIIQREVDNKRIGFVTVTNVVASKDLKHAKVYVSVLGNAVEMGEVERFSNSVRVTSAVYSVVK